MSHFSELAAEAEQARLDADADRYHDICDEPPMPGTQDYEDSKGDYICHQKRDE